MPLPKAKFRQLNDGVVSIYRDTSERTTFAARNNTLTRYSFTFVVKLDFDVMSKRVQDQQFAEQNGFTLSMKIHTRSVKGVDNKCKAVIDGMLYDVAYIDKAHGDAYLYLEGVRAIDP